MNITIINDCNDSNDSARQVIRAKALFKSQPTFVAIKNELEAAGNIIDAIDALGNESGVIIANVAPRGGKGKKFENGTPFGYFWYKKILIVSSVDGFALSLVKKLNLTKFVNVLDTEESLKILAKNKCIKKEQINQIKNSQFRSFDFEPRVAHYLWKNKNIKSKKIKIEEISDAPKAIWWVDNFGNCKTTVFANEAIRGEFAKKFSKIKYFDRLKDVPDSQPAIITGSSGVNDKRFLEIVVQGKSAEKHFKLFSGQLLT